MREKPGCEVCRKIFKETQKRIEGKIGREEKLTELEQERWMLEFPDCDTCLETKEGELLLSGNQDAWRVYQATQSQLIIAPMGGVISVNQLAVWAWIDRYKIKNPVKVFEQVMLVSTEMINDRNEDIQMERKQ